MGQLDDLELRLASVLCGNHSLTDVNACLENLSFLSI